MYDYLSATLRSSVSPEMAKVPYISHYNDVIMGSIASQITSLTFIYSSVYSGADQRKHQNSTSLAFVRGIHRSPVNSPHKGPVTRQMFPFDGVIMLTGTWGLFCHLNQIQSYLVLDRRLVARPKNRTEPGQIIGTINDAYCPWWSTMKPLIGQVWFKCDSKTTTFC